jgi:hypothetical protein
MGGLSVDQAVFFEVKIGRGNATGPRSMLYSAAASLNCMMRFLILLLLVPCVWSCNRYKAYERLYTFQSTDAIPHYSDLDYWAAHPYKWDPSDSVPTPLQSGFRDSITDVFFLHPTTYTRSKINKLPNAPIDAARINAKTDYSTILYQASAFNEQSRIFAPRYRQAHIRNFFQKDKDAAQQAFDLAYEDIRTAFEYYLAHWNKGRPIILASHSQGAFMMNRLLKDYFENKALKNKLVVAYVIGWPVNRGQFSSLEFCRDSLQTGCIISWRTMHKGYVPWYLKKQDNAAALVTNPLNWRTDAEYAPRSRNKGSLLKSFTKLYPETTDAWIKNGFLYTHHPKFPGSFLFLRRNYHIGDINLFYVNLREDVKRRIGLFWKK